MKRFLIFTLIISIASFLILILYFLASSEIYHDYISQRALINLGLSEKIGELPKWAICESLWSLMRLDFIIRIVLSLLVIAMLIILITSKLKVSLLLIITIIFSIIAWSFLILYFLASSDIYNEYISKESFKILAPDNINMLGNSPSCMGEWNFLQLDLYVRTAFTLFISGVLIFLINSNNIKQLSRK